MNNNKIKLTKEKREYMISAIHTYFSNERDEDLGILASVTVLDFFMNELSTIKRTQGDIYGTALLQI